MMRRMNVARTNAAQRNNKQQPNFIISTDTVKQNKNKTFEKKTY